MNKLLHITNGDAFTNILKKMPVEGAIITWREVLCEGKTTTDVGSESFWKTRFEFLKTTYKTTKQTFIEKTLKEYRRLCNEKQQDEIVLWFDNDLFCQINMIAVISWLKKYRPNVPISLVSPSRKSQFFSSLTQDKLVKLFNKRIPLTNDDIAFADYVWQIYCSDSPIRLQSIIQPANSNFNYLLDAIQLHLTRFPSVYNGLNSVENFVISEAVSKNLNSKDELISSLLFNEKDFGYGDLQYISVVDNLKPLFEGFNPVKLNVKGKEILDAASNFYAELRNDNVFLGGSKKYDFLYNNNTGKLLKL